MFWHALRSCQRVSGKIKTPSTLRFRKTLQRKGKAGKPARFGIYAYPAFFHIGLEFFLFGFSYSRSYILYLRRDSALP